MTNFRNVLKAYTILRSLTDGETALLETLRSMTDTERELTVAALSPEPVKRATKKAAKGAGKSRRAASIGTQLQQVRQLDGGVSKMRCAYVSDDGDDPTTCGEYADANIHHLQFKDGYHEFVPEFVSALTAKDDNYEEQAGAATGD